MIGTVAGSRLISERSSKTAQRHAFERSAKMYTQPRRVSSDTLESDLQIVPRRERLKFTVHHSGPILLAGGFAILVLLIFITGLGVVSRATLLFSEVSTTNTEFRQLSLDLERLRSDVSLAGSYARDQLFDADSDSIEDRRNRFLKARPSRGSMRLKPHKTTLFSTRGG